MLYAFFYDNLKVEPMIDIRNATVVHEGATFLYDVSLRISRDEDVAIIGPNGAGKSSLVKLITREYYPLRKPGSYMKVDGKEVWDLLELRNLFGIVSPDLQSEFRKDITGLETVLSGFYGSIGTYGYQKPTDAMIERSLEVMGSLELSHLSERPVSRMSTGEARKLLIARALVSDPQALILDEPTASLDIKASHDFLTTLRQIARAKNVLMITHHINEIIPEITRVVMIKEGRIFLDGIKEDVLTSENISKLFETPLEVHESGGYYSLGYR